MSLIQIKFEHIYKKYHKYILKDYNIKIDNKNINFIIGHNGTGKSTLIKCLFNLINYQGRIIINKNIKLIYIPEKIFLPDYMKMMDFIKSITNQSNEKILNYLIKFNIDQYYLYYITNLSLGTKQKMLLVTSLLQEADGYIFDEPLNGLDENSINVFSNLLNELRRQEKLIIIISHRINNYNIENKNIIEIGNNDD